MLLSAPLGFLAVLSLVLMLWQWFVAWRFPLHERVGAHSFAPAVTLLKPLKGSDSHSEECLRSWFAQDYTGPVQILFGVGSAEVRVCEIVRKLLRENPKIDAELIVCGPPTGANSKVSKLVELARLAKHDILIVSDSDVLVPQHLLTNVTALLRNPETGLVSCFYRLANPTTLAMQWEAVAINADFWSQVLQANSLKPMDFALGAVMAVRRESLEKIGGFTALVNCLADDYQLGNRIARGGQKIALSPVVVECWSEPMGWLEVWTHQLRWARTIRVCQPAPYFFSILSNATLWPALWLAANPSELALVFCLGCLGLRIATATHLQQKLTGTRKHYPYNNPSLKPNFSRQPPLPESLSPRGGEGWAPLEPDSAIPNFSRQPPLPESLSPRGGERWPPLEPDSAISDGKGYWAWLVPIKDLLQTAIWLAAFGGNQIEWRGQKMRLRRDGTLQKR